MTTPARGGYARGSRPASPGDLTARIHRDNQRKAEAARRAKEGADPYETGFGAGWNSGFDRGWDAGIEAIIKEFQAAGIDTAAVLALNDDEEDE
jgi:hypothetical protein